MSFFDKFSNFFNGKTQKPLQPELIENIRLLEGAKLMIETGVFVRFFKKPFIGLIELIVYSFSFALALGGYFLYDKIADLISAVCSMINFVDILTNANWDFGGLTLIKLVLFIFLMLPAFFSFLMARLFTRSRHRINLFVDVEKILDKVISNLKSTSSFK